MPTGPGVRFRFRTLKSGKKQRLAFNRNNKVIEVKNPGERAKLVNEVIKRRAKKKK